jgi:pyridoxamine 5'-phosphate oxidase
MNPDLNNIATIRQEYCFASLDEKDIDSNPITQFQKWFNEAVRAEIADVNAMTLSTVDIDSKPHARIVLLKGVEDAKFTFFTNYQSHKGLEIENNPHVSLVFHWKELQRQVRIEGSIIKISESESSSYFKSRPKESQLGAWASFQSQVLSGRDELENRFDELKKKYADAEIPKPPHWGGYAVTPSLLEFWQGRESRLHDRFCFTLQEDKSWKMNRLNP